MRGAHALRAAADQCNFSVHTSHEGVRLPYGDATSRTCSNFAGGSTHTARHGDSRRAHRHRQLRQPRAEPADRGCRGSSSPGSGCPPRTRWARTPASWPAWTSTTGIAADRRPRRDHRGQARLRRLLRDGRHPADARRWRDVRTAPVGGHQRRRLGARRAAVPVGADSRTRTSRRSKTLRGKVIRASSSPASTRASPPTCCRSRWPAPASASSRSAPWRSPTTRPTTATTVMFDVMGFGNAIGGPARLLFQPGVLAAAWGTAIRQLAAGLGVEVDEITETPSSRSRHPRTSTSRSAPSRRARSRRCASRSTAWSRASR